jgi:hypothetical protein
MRTSLASLGFALSLAAPLAPLAGQATLIGRAVDDSSGVPVVGAEVVIERSSRRIQSDQEGRFRFTGIPLGTSFVMVRKIGYRPVRLRALVFGPDTLEVEVRLRATITELEPIEVTAAAVPPGMNAFAEHRAGGQGTFIDWHTLRASEHRRVSDLLRGVRGVQTLLGRGNRVIAATGRGRCPMAVWLDGVRIYQPGQGTPPSIDDWPVAQLDAIEIYRGAAETPGDLGGTGASCGTIVLWTRRR